MRCCIGWNDNGDADRRATSSWLKSVGLDTLDERPGPRLRERVFEIGLVRTPDILATFARLEDTLTVCRMTRDGITFYLTDVPFTLATAATGDREPMIEPERAEGYLFIPMSNVVCINEFGSIRRVDLRGNLTPAGPDPAPA